MPSITLNKLLSMNGTKFIPLLAIAGLHMRQIMGYTFVIFIITGVIYGSAMLYLGSG